MHLGKLLFRLPQPLPLSLFLVLNVDVISGASSSLEARKEKRTRES